MARGGERLAEGALPFERSGPRREGRVRGGEARAEGRPVLGCEQPLERLLARLGHREGGLAEAQAPAEAEAEEEGRALGGRERREPLQREAVVLVVGREEPAELEAR